MSGLLAPGYLKWDGSKYVLVATVQVVGTASGDLSGAYPNPVVAGLQGLPVAATVPTSGQVLAWSGTAWTPSATGSSVVIGGDLFATSSTTQEVVGLLTHSLPALSTGYLNWTGSTWSFTTLPTTLPPDGAAGGDLGGTYPNPLVEGISIIRVPLGP
jgi:hypothetical protein